MGMQDLRGGEDGVVSVRLAKLPLSGPICTLTV